MSERLHELLAPVVTSLGYELWHLEQLGGGDNGLLRLYIDADQGITLDDCTRVSREVSATLDVEDPISGSFDLEVSSPGMDRPLVTAGHFRRFAGERAKFTLYAAVDGKRRFTAAIIDVVDEVLSVRLDGADLDISLGNIAKAKLAPDYGASGANATA